MQREGAGTRSENQVQDGAERASDVIGVFICARAHSLSYERGMWSPKATAEQRMQAII